MVVVDHRRPLHDGFCRCSGCKPNPVAAQGTVTKRVEVAGLLALGLVIVGAVCR